MGQRMYDLKWLLIVALSIFFFVVFATYTFSGEAPCPVPSIDQKDKLIGAGYNTIARKYWRTFDLNGDRIPDYHIEYDIRGIREDKTFILSTFPTTYYLDTSGNGVYDKIYVDMQGNGRCEDLREFIGKETTE